MVRGQVDAEPLCLHVGVLLVELRTLHGAHSLEIVVGDYGKHALAVDGVAPRRKPRDVRSAKELERLRELLPERRNSLCIA